MTRFNNNRDYRRGGKNLFVMLRNPGHGLVRPEDGLAADKMPGVLRQARQRLMHAYARLNPNPTRTAIKYASRYFLTRNSGIASLDLQRIKTLLILTIDGLAADQTFKIGIRPGSGNAQAHGEVNFQPAPYNLNAKPYYNEVRDLDDNLNKKAGAIKLNSNTILNPKLGVVTLMHEATHKYAGTDDKCYFDDDGIAPEPPDVLNNKDDALINADSYAWFAYYVGASAENFPHTPW